MPLTVKGNAAERAAVETILRQICPEALVDPATGAVAVQQPQPLVPPLGTCCLLNLINSPFQTTIVPLPAPGAPLPGAGGMTIGAGGGGATDIPPGGALRPGPGGIKVNGPGAGATVYFDLSDNNGDGYFIYDEMRVRRDEPLFIILFHELCTGHATQSIYGTDDPGNPERNPIACENVFRAAQKPPYATRKGATGGMNPRGGGRAPR